MNPSNNLPELIGSGGDRRLRAHLPAVLGLAVFLCAVALRAQATYSAPYYTFSTLAGLAPSIGSADGVGSAASFSGPRGVTVDAMGNVFVAAGVIRKITPDGVVTTFAGLADGATPVKAMDVAVDGSGNIYVVDSSSMIRKITPTGVVTTIAGSTSGGLGSSDGVGSAAQFRFPSGIAVDSSGNVYVADAGNHTIRKITADGVVTTLAGSAGQAGSADGTGSAASFFFPSDLVVDPVTGDLYVVDSANYTIRKVTPEGVVTTFAGSPGNSGTNDGIGAEARFSTLNSIGVDGSGYVYVADTGNSTIRKITPAGMVTTLAGSANAAGSLDGVGNAARFYYPLGITVDASGNIYVADTGNSSIRKVTPVGVVSTLAGRVGSIGSADGLGSEARFSGPAALTVDAAGNTYVADYENHTIRKVTASGAVTTFAGAAGIEGYGNADGTGTSARFAFPSAIAVDGSGNLFVAEYTKGTIRKITPAAVVMTIAGAIGEYGSTDGAGPAARFAYGGMGLAVDGSGNVYVADTYNHTIRKITPAGVVATLAGAAGLSGAVDGPGASARFKYPSGIAVDSSGNVYVADASFTIRKITAAGVVTTLAGAPGSYGYGVVDGLGSAARFWDPRGVAVDGVGNVYVADTTNGAIRKITPSGRVTTLGGATGPGHLGVGGIADGTAGAALFNKPRGIAVDSLGNLYIADTGSNTIRKGTPAAHVATDFNNDGHMDILWQNTATGQRALWLLNGSDFTPTNIVSLGWVDTNWSMAATTDFNGDGFVDILWENTATGQRALWLMNGSDFTPTSVVSLGWVDASWSMAAAADFNGDGFVDILWENTATGQRALWLMNGSDFTPASVVSLGWVSPDWSMAAGTDFNGDGRMDILWQNLTTGQRALWLMNGGDFTPTSVVSLGWVDPSWSMASTADNNADGHVDIFWQNTATGQRALWLMNGGDFTPTNIVNLGFVPAEWTLVK